MRIQETVQELLTGMKTNPRRTVFHSILGVLLLAGGVALTSYFSGFITNYFWPSNPSTYSKYAPQSIGNNSIGNLQLQGDITVNNNQYPLPELTYQIASSSQEVSVGIYETNIAVRINFVPSDTDDNNAAPFIKNTHFNSSLFRDCQLQKETVGFMVPLGLGRALLHFNMTCLSKSSIKLNEDVKLVWYEG